MNEQIEEFILQDLRERKLTQREIAQKYGYSPATIVRLVQKNNLRYGRGVKNHWEFQEVSKALCHIMGAYLTDGSIGKEYRTEKPRQFLFTNVDTDLANQVHYLLGEIGLRATIIKRPAKKLSPLTKQDQYCVGCYSSQFAKWLYDITQNKQILPNFVFETSTENIMAFLSTALDGDGSVKKSGCIVIGKSKGWIRELPRLLNKIGIRNNGGRVDRVLASGAEMIAVSVRREDFVRLGGKCTIKEKQERIENGKETRNRKPKPWKNTCPKCGKPKIKNARHCQECYQSSNQFQEHLENISSKGNRAANIARWGTDHLSRPGVRKK